MKIKYCFLSVLGFIFALAFNGCKKDEQSTTPFDYSYFPMAVGDSLVYDVTAYNRDIVETDSSYQLLERVESIFDDNEGRPTFRLERYVRNVVGEPWTIYKVWTANRTIAQVEKKEDNITYIKLLFPVEKNLSWDGNIKNIAANQKEDYRITSFNEPLNLGSIYFDSTLTVTQEDDSSFIENIYHAEVYAKGIGMIYKVQSDSLQGNRVSRYTETLIYSNK